MFTRFTRLNPNVTRNANGQFNGVEGSYTGGQNQPITYSMIDRLKLRGLVKAVLLFGATSAGNVTRFGYTNGAVTTENVPLPDKTWYQQWNIKTALSDYLGIDSSCGLAGVSQATVICSASAGSTGAMYAQAGSLTGDSRFGLAIVGTTLTALANGTTAYGTATQGSATKAIWAVVFNGGGSANAGRLTVWRMIPPAMQITQMTLTFTGTVGTALSTGLTRLDVGRQIINGTPSAGNGNHNWALFFNTALSVDELKTIMIVESPLPQNLNDSRSIAPYVYFGRSASMHLNFPVQAVSAAMFRSRSASRASFAGHHRMVGAGQ
jgi:hypothetical protein